MQKYGIDFRNALELGQMFHVTSFHPVDGDNREFVMNSIRKTFRKDLKALTDAEVHQLFKKAGIDRSNAIAYYNENRKYAHTQLKDVYGNLIEFVKKNRARDILIDECPILMNPISKSRIYFI